MQIFLLFGQFIKVDKQMEVCQWIFICSQTISFTVVFVAVILYVLWNYIIIFTNGAAHSASCLTGLKVLALVLYSQSPSTSELGQCSGSISNSCHACLNVGAMSILSKQWL